MKKKFLTVLIAGVILVASVSFSESCKKDDPTTDSPITVTEDSPVTDIDGNVYRTVKIGNQIWMVESLRTTRFNDGQPIPNVIATSAGIIDPAWGNIKTAAYCFGNYNSSLRLIYGAWYNWYAVNTGKLAPIGWHVPTVAEWNTLIEYLGGKSVAGGKMKSPGTDYWFSPNLGATNSSGFSAYPAGYRNYDGLVPNLTGDLVSFWASDQANANEGCGARLNSDSKECRIGEYSVKKSYGYSVRCVKD